jgi:hypothetical protein
MSLHSNQNADLNQVKSENELDFVPLVERLPNDYDFKTSLYQPRESAGTWNAIEL